MKIRTTPIVLSAVLVVALSSCSVFKATKDWSYRMGEKMPTYADNRCESSYFCFGEDKGHQQRSPARGAAAPTQQMMAVQPIQPVSPSQYNASGYQQPVQHTGPVFPASQQPTYPLPTQAPVGQAWQPPAGFDPDGSGITLEQAMQDDPVPSKAAGNSNDLSQQPSADEIYDQLRARHGLAPIAQAAPQHAVDTTMKMVHPSVPGQPNPSDRPTWDDDLPESPYNELIRSLDAMPY